MYQGRDQGDWELLDEAAEEGRTAWGVVWYRGAEPTGVVVEVWVAWQGYGDGGGIVVVVVMMITIECKRNSAQRLRTRANQTFVSKGHSAAFKFACMLMLSRFERSGFAVARFPPRSAPSIELNQFGVVGKQAQPLDMADPES